MTDNFLSLYSDTANVVKSYDEMISAAESYLSGGTVSSTSQVNAVRLLRIARDEAQQSLDSLLLLRDEGLKAFVTLGTPTICPCENARLAA